MTVDRGNREFKSSLFVDYFNDKEKLLEMYSAIIGEVVEPEVDIQINTLSDVLFKGLINDISFVIDGRLVVLVEHQSTPNANMPLRMLQYYNEIIKRRMDDTDSRAIYWTKLHKIPRPEFIVLYNGTTPIDDKETLRLSDAFEEGEAKGQLELTVTMYNINPGHNE
ncbi:MAG: Rpn family recombination-promoting nuclease/putative transposase, partial [Clostridiales Family XIII bacterium]|nr:Rpn family recombination-promoting nuclease/putative transposase [Clostridiales Family XIII bacterium]